MQRPKLHGETLKKQPGRDWVLKLAGDEMQVVRLKGGNTSPPPKSGETSAQFLLDPECYGVRNTMKPVLDYDMDLHLPLELQQMEHCIKIWNFDSFKAGFSFDPGLAVKDSDIWNSSDSSLRGHVSSDQKNWSLGNTSGNLFRSSSPPMPAVGISIMSGFCASGNLSETLHLTVMSPTLLNL